MSKLTEKQFSDIQNIFDNMGGMLVLRHEVSEYVSDIYKIELKDNPLIDNQYHPINLTKQCINMLESIAGNKISFNNTRTTFWVL